MQAVSHQWIIECCQSSALVNKSTYLLPSGWSIVENQYKRWSVGRSLDQRKSSIPFNKITVCIASQQNDFIQFWSRCCKLAGAKIGYIKSKNDITETTQHYMLMDDEFPMAYRTKAEYFHIPVVSTVWIVQSLICGKVCEPTAHEKLQQLYEDDNFN